MDPVSLLAMLHVLRDNVTQEQEDPWLASLRIPCKNGYIYTILHLCMGAILWER